MCLYVSNMTNLKWLKLTRLSLTLHYCILQLETRLFNYFSISPKESTPSFLFETVQKRASFPKRGSESSNFHSRKKVFSGMAQEETENGGDGKTQRERERERERERMSERRGGRTDGREWKGELRLTPTFSCVRSARAMFVLGNAITLSYKI